MTERNKEGAGAERRNPAVQQRRKTALAALVMLVPFCGCLYLIFGGSSREEAVSGAGNINLTVPDGRSSGIEASKQKAIENVRMQQRQQERSLAFDAEAFSLMQDSARQAPRPVRENPVARSQQANRQAAEAMRTFYEQPRRNPEVERLQKQVEELSAQLEGRAAATPDPMELAERQFQLAAKYLNTQGGTPQPGAAGNGRKSSGGKHAVVPVRSVGNGTVSTLAVIEPDSLLRELGRERNLGFNTAVGASSGEGHNSIRVCVDEDQTLTGGDRVRLRLMEPVSAGGRTLEAGSLLYGVASIDGQRLGIGVESIEHGGEIIPVELTAYDLDGGEGLYIPDSKERTAARDAAASIGTGLGTSISFARSAGQQVAMDLVRGAMTGGTQYLASKLREVRVSVKAGHQLLLISKE